MYTDYKNIGLEQRLEGLLDAAGIFYHRSETWIEGEGLYEVLYAFEMEGESNVEEE